MVKRATESFLEKLAMTRRNFFKGTAALGASAAIYGCGKDSDTEYVYSDSGGTNPTNPVDPIEIETYYGSSGHNCGGRCITVAQVSKGRILRFLTDENKYTADGTYIDPESRNFPQTRACARCRAYKYRLYHPGRLRYPLKQTKTRGDLDGFIRISWDKALEEISTKHENVLKDYGVDGIYQIYACGSVSSELNGAQSGSIGKTNGYAMKMMGGVQTPMFGSYSTHQYTYFGMNYTGCDGDNSQVNPNSIAKHTNTLVLWGDNSMSTGNPSSYASIKAVEDMKKRNPDAKVIYLGPEFVDTAVTLADEWYVQRPFTDPAVVAGMVYHMLENTFNLNTGALRENPWLDVDYLDTLVYGFFDSPGYWLDTRLNTDDTDTTVGINKAHPDNGIIHTQNPYTLYSWSEQDGPWYEDHADHSVHITTASITVEGEYTTYAKRWTNGSEYSYTEPFRYIDEVPKGRSYVSWVLGDNGNARAYGDTSVANNYTAARYAAIDGTMPRWNPCDYDNSKQGNTEYFMKKDFKTPKTPQWASDISGIPKEQIEELARLYCKAGPVAARWSGGLQKHAEGIPNLFAVQSLHIITKNVGTPGSGYYWVPFTSAALEVDEGLTLNSHRPDSPYVVGAKPSASCTAWHTALKMGFGNELKENGYTGRYIPNMESFNTGEVYWDDGGTKAFIEWERDEKGNIKTFEYGGKKYYWWKGYEAGQDPLNPLYQPKRFAGIRLLYNPGGNIIINQHENSNDSMEMLRCLPKSDHTKADTFTLVSIDNFLSPTPRWSDYVLPASTFWEQQDIVTPTGHGSFYTPQVITPPGESKPLWDIGADLVKTYAYSADLTDRINTANKVATDDVINGYYGGASAPRTVEGIVKAKFDALKTNAASKSPYKDMTWEEYLRKPFLPAKPDDFAVPVLARQSLMEEFAKFRSTGTKLVDSPFVQTLSSSKFVPTNEYNEGGYGNQFADVSDVPKSARRFQLYSPVLIWQYTHKFSMWHGYLPEKEQGQQHTDYEGDPLVLPIAVYYDHRDYFMEAYGGFTRYNSAKDVLEGLDFCLTTTHNRYRSHSSMAENPILRELSHRVPGQDEKGNYKPANDYNDYSVAPAQAFAVNAGGDYPPLSARMNDDGSVNTEYKDVVSYSEIWMNKADAAGLDIRDGDLVQVENPIGAVRCVARVTNRCAKGFVGLHQGCWYDPRKMNNYYNHEFVDVGGNCNTLMASQPSRIDHGNGQQSAMVRITKVTDY